MSKEFCICAAVKASDGQIIRCHRHAYGIANIHGMGLTIPREWNAQGFITSTGRYVNRVEGKQLQREAGIKSVNPGGEVSGGELFSEDLY